MSIAHSRANSSWLRSRTSSLKPCKAPSGTAMRRTGRSRLDSHEAALMRCERCSRFVLISSRRRMPRMVGTRPRAWYGSIMANPFGHSHEPAGQVSEPCHAGAARSRPGAVRGARRREHAADERAETGRGPGAVLAFSAAGLPDGPGDPVAFGFVVHA